MTAKPTSETSQYPMRSDHAIPGFRSSSARTGFHFSATVSLRLGCSSDDMTATPSIDSKPATTAGLPLRNAVAECLREFESDVIVPNLPQHLHVRPMIPPGADAGVLAVAAVEQVGAALADER